MIQEKIGNRYGNWTVLEFHKIDKHHDARWFCKCNGCGEIYSVRGYTLRNGQSTQCEHCARRSKHGRVV